MVLTRHSILFIYLYFSRIQSHRGADVGTGIVEWYMVPHIHPSLSCQSGAIATIKNRITQDILTTWVNKLSYQLI